MNVKLLLVEDNSDHASIIMDCAQKGFRGQVEIDWVDNLKLALKKINEGKHDVCLVDLDLPDSSTDETIETLEKLKSSLPFIVLTSASDDKIALKMIQDGVQDFLSKADLEAKLLFRTCLFAMERKKYTSDLEIKNRDQKLFCQSLSHDFRAPIRRIANSIQFLKEDLSRTRSLNSNEEKHFNIVNKNIKTINSLIDSLYKYLYMSDEQPNYTLVNLSDLVGEASQLANQDFEKDLKILADNLPNIEGNREQLLILFVNLFNNAIKYNQREPVIKIVCHMDEKQQFCQIAVQDNGIGIEQKYFDKIFAPFQRLHTADEFPGTGLGLSLVKRIVENHRGSIWVESTPMVGSTFYIKLPYLQG